MTTYYARANLNDLGDTTGYSLTSGGPSAGARPSTSSDNLIFDQNSGPTRTITGSTTGLYFGGLIMSLGNPMNFTGTLNLLGNSVLKGTVYGLVLNGQTDSNGNVIAYHLDATQCVVGDGGVKSNYSPAYWVLDGSTFVTTGEIYLNDSTSYVTLAAQNMTVTCGAITVTDHGRLSAGTGGLNLVVTRTQGIFGAVVSMQAAVVNGSIGSLTVTDTSSAIKTVNITGLTMAFVNNTGNAQGTGGVQFGSSSNHTFTTFDAGKGATTLFIGGYSFTATNWILDGSGQYNTLKSTSTTLATLGKAGGGTIAANFCNFNYLGTVSSPATTVRATNSKSTGSSGGIVLVPQTGRGLQFF
jgi:hypothetical protein